MASKVIVFGSVNGQLSSLFAKLAKLQSKTPFSFALITGNLFADPSHATPDDDEQVDSLISGIIVAPLPVYFTVGTHALPSKVVERLKVNNDEICPDVSYLGKKSTFKTSEGIRIVTLGGLLNPNVMSAAATEDDKYLPFHTEADAKSLNGAHSADIMVTSTWPAGVANGSKVNLPEPLEVPSEDCTASLCSTLKPKYHFSSSPDLFFEREPFYFPPPENDPQARPFTRFISLGSLTSPTKAKSLYAFNIQSASAPLMALPAGATPSPLASSVLGKRATTSQAESFSRFGGMENQRSHHDSNGNKRRKRDRDRNQTRRPPSQAECFFCLSNPNLSTHLITAIGDDSYLTTSRGPVSSASTFAPTLKFPAHILIIPLAHVPTIASIVGEGGDGKERKAAFAEMTRYRRALNSMLSAHGHGKYGSVCWEISKQGGVHVHWQWMPIDAEMIGKGLVEAGFKVEAENAQYSAFEKREVEDGMGVGGDWFRVWLWRPRGGEKDEAIDLSASKDKDATTDANGHETSLFLPIDPTQRFDLQFGRRVVAKLLGTPERAHWKDCPQTVDEEMADARAFKEAFKAWDFSA